MAVVAHSTTVTILVVLAVVKFAVVVAVTSNIAAGLDRRQYCCSSGCIGVDVAGAHFRAGAIDRLGRKSVQRKREQRGWMRGRETAQHNGHAPE